MDIFVLERKDYQIGVLPDWIETDGEYYWPKEGRENYVPIEAEEMIDGYNGCFDNNKIFSFLVEQTVDDTMCVFESWEVVGVYNAKKKAEEMKRILGIEEYRISEFNVDHES